MKAAIAPEVSADRPAWAEINLFHLTDNLQIIRQHIQQNTQIMAVVKADSYGHGAVEIANSLINQGIGQLAVAIAEEGIALRKAGITVPILILGFTPPEQAVNVVEYHLTPMVCTLPFASALVVAARQKKQKVKVHIRVDVSSGSLGISPEECGAFAMKLMLMEWLIVEGIFTHLASTYGGDPADINKDLSKFNEGLRAIEELGIHIPVIHAASSPAIVNIPEACFNLVRPGIMLYGLPALEGEADIGLKPLMQLKAKIMYIKLLEQGTGLGYGYRYKTEPNLRIAMIPLGYADCSFLFHFRKGDVLIHGKRAPIVGQVYMDHFMVDITHLPDVCVGDVAVLLGEQENSAITFREVAQKANLGEMNCDILSLLGPRVPRIYLGKQQAQ